MKAEIVVGARASMLSVSQTETVIRLLECRAPGCRFVFKKISTLGDRSAQWQRSDTGIFVKELEEALKSREIDMAVHSVKDLPTKIPRGLSVGAVTARLDPRDLLVTRDRNTSLAGLAAGAVVGTMSLRRKAQLLSRRPDIAVADLRGNLDTRLRKLNDGLFDAIIVAAAGVRRLGCRGLNARAIPVREMLPACGQGALAVEIRVADTDMKRLAGTIDHAATRACITAERSFLRHTGAGCRMPVACYAVVRGRSVALEGMIISLDGSRSVRMKTVGAAADAESLGRQLARAVLRTGGTAILKEIQSGSS